jgi:hypothetical protein
MPRWSFRQVSARVNACRRLRSNTNAREETQEDSDLPFSLHCKLENMPALRMAGFVCSSEVVYFPDRQTMRHFSAVQAVPCLCSFLIHHMEHPAWFRSKRLDWWGTALQILELLFVMLFVQSSTVSASSKQSIWWNRKSPIILQISCEYILKFKRKSLVNQKLFSYELCFWG